MKTLKFIALLIVILVFTVNNGNAQDKKSEGDYWTEVTIVSECLPEAITGDIYVQWTSFKSLLWHEVAYGTFTGESGVKYYCNWTFSFRFNATHETGGLLQFQSTTWIRKESDNSTVAKLQIMSHTTWANDLATAEINIDKVVCMGN